MTYKYRVTLSGLKGFYRLYSIGSTQTLYTFHKQMRSDMEFPQDQLILFKAFDAEGAVAARYGLFDLGDGAVDSVTMADTLKKGVVSFTYFYDVTNRKSVVITFEGESEEEATLPVLSDTKGPNPIEFENGYVAFEDLPDEKKRLPGEKDEKKGGLAGLLGIDLDEDDEDEDDGEEDDEDEEDEDREEDEQIYDENEGF